MVLATCNNLPPYEALKCRLQEGNYDDALVLVNSWDQRAVIANTVDQLANLRIRCMISDVLDYAGAYKMAALALVDQMTGQHSGMLAERDFQVKVRGINDLGDPAYAKQQCWALMLWGMVFYRAYDLDRAMVLFELARRIVSIIHESGVVSSIGTLARCWYCIGLVHREKRTKEARAAFRQSIELASKGIEDRGAGGQPSAAFDYNLARCYGLGMGWIDYNEARLAEAAGALFMARRVMSSTRAKFISKYLDVVQATIIMSESAEARHIREALALLNDAYATFDPPGTLGTERDKDKESLLRHTHYALRCQNEIALGHLRLARTCQDDPKQWEENLIKAEVSVEKVKTVSLRQLKSARRPYCTALIIEARIKRERAKYEKDPTRARDLNNKALELAEKAKNAGSRIKLILIDALIGIGEAELALGHAKAIASFEEALSKAKDNRKDAAVCHLHLCRSHLLIDQPVKAAEHFNVWESIKIGLENAFIANLAEEVRKMLFHVYEKFELSKGDVIRGRDSTEYLNSLRKWLAETAIALENGDHKLAAERLLINQKTLNSWLEF